jgi:hypothetical protein
MALYEHALSSSCLYGTRGTVLHPPISHSFCFFTRFPILQLNSNVNPFQHSFVGEIHRIEEMARCVHFFATQIERERDLIPIRPLYDLDPAPLIAIGPRTAQTMEDLDVKLSEHES